MGSNVSAYGGGGGCADGRDPSGIALRRILGRLRHRIGIAGSDESKRAEGIDACDRDFVGHAAKPDRDPVRQRRADPSPHPDVIAVNGDATIGADLHPAQRAIRSSTAILGGASDAGAGESASLGARFLLSALLPDRMSFELVQNLRRAN